MQRVYTLFSTTLLVAFVLMVALKSDSEFVKLESISFEETDIEDLEDSEKEEIEFQLKDINKFTAETTISTVNRTVLVDYHFAIKSNYRQISLPPPKV